MSRWCFWILFRFYVSSNLEENGARKRQLTLLLSRTETLFDRGFFLLQSLGDLLDGNYGARHVACCMHGYRDDFQDGSAWMNRLQRLGTASAF